MSEKATSLEEEGRMETLLGCGLRFLPEILSFLVACTQASTSQLYLVYASCERLYPDRTDCTVNTKHDDHIQDVAASYLLLYQIILQVPAMIFLPCFGSLSDKLGRKILVLISCSGCAVAFLLNLISTMNPGRYVYLMFVGAFLRSLVCKADFIRIASTTVAIETTSEEKRTAKLSFMVASKYTGKVLSFGLQVILLEKARFDYIFTLDIGIFLVIALLTVFLMPDSKATKKKEDSEVKSERKLPFHHLWESFKVLSHRPQGESLLALWAVMLISLFRSIIESCENELIVLYVTRNIPSFALADFSWYWIAEKLCYIALVTVGMYLCKKLSCRDTSITVGAALACVIEFSMLSVTHTVTMLYVATIIGSASALLPPIIKSFISVIVSEEYYSRVYSVQSCLESASSVLGPVLLLNMYRISVDFYSGLVLAVSAGMYFIVALLCVYLKIALDDAKTGEKEALTKEDKREETVREKEED